jgi:hypothetical protein
MSAGVLDDKQWKALCKAVAKVAHSFDLDGIVFAGFRFHEVERDGEEDLDLEMRSGFLNLVTLPIGAKKEVQLEALRAIGSFDFEDDSDTETTVFDVREKTGKKH